MDSTTLFTLPPSPSSFSHLMMESEEDFTFGAKTTSFLPPATTTTTTTTIHAAASPSTTAVYDLPDWMEDREILGMPSAFHDLLLPPLKEEDDLSCTIKPEDMLVPLSELQPSHIPASPPLASTPPVSPARIPVTLTHVPAIPPTVTVSPPPAPATIKPANTTLPKIIICRKVTSSASQKAKPVQVQYQIMPAKQVAQVSFGTPPALHTAPQIPNMTLGKSHEDQASVHPAVSSKDLQVSLTVPQNAPVPQVPQACDAEQLINEMVEMISGNSSDGDFQGLGSADFDSSMMEANMDDLLSQLEDLEQENTPLVTQYLPPASPASQFISLPSESPLSHSVPSPNPSESFSSLSVPSPHPSKSPFSVPVPSPHPSESSFTVSLPSPSPNPSEFTLPASPISLPSPVPSVGSLSPAQSTSDSLFVCGEASHEIESLEDEEWSPLEETHSYSKSQRKARSSRRTPSARATPYPADRKERKKEQNKQAALRYRQKKKQEEDDMMGLVRKEEERQEKLKAKYTSLKQELSYLKKIMREVFIAKGMLSEEALKKAAVEKKKKKSSK